ncbi:MAG TPA: hypothetical protein VE650_19160 [Acetobacteraceae bacterium]|jgi:hypothetical protein|nr:hypothetical protein [Acetobacteraceae bacterium]
MRCIVFAAAMLAAAPVLAQTKEWTPAPVPAVGPAGAVAPAERAGRSSGPDHSAPFSDIPTGSPAAGGQTSSNTTGGVGTPSVSR